jgi:hypothetical protein
MGSSFGICLENDQTMSPRGKERDIQHLSAK